MGWVMADKASLNDFKRFYSQLEAKRDLLMISRVVAERSSGRQKTKAYVRDKAGELYMTLCPTLTRADQPVVDVDILEFRTHFSRFSALIKSGLCFRLRLKRSPHFIYARRHTSYFDPLQHIIESWRQQVISKAVMAGASSDVRHWIEAALADGINAGVGSQVGTASEDEHEEGQPPTVKVVSRPRSRRG